MKRSLIAVTLTGAAILSFLSISTSAQDVDWKKGKLGRLAGLIGTYNNDALLDDPQVKQAMTLAVGKDVGLLRQNLATRGAIDFIDRNLVLAGQAPHLMGGAEEAAIWVKMYDGSVRAVIMHQGKVTIYAKEAQYDHLPAQFRSYVRSLVAPSGEEAPPGVRWRK
jgi:hypothetical protein